MLESGAGVIFVGVDDGGRVEGLNLDFKINLNEGFDSLCAIRSSQRRQCIAF